MDNLVNEQAVILSNEQVGPNLYVVTVEVANIPEALMPGQFVHMLIPGMEGHILRRPFSVFYTDLQAGTLSILYQTVGFGSRHLATLEAGAKLELIGPIGHGWTIPEGTTRALLVAGGVGAAPLFMHAHALRNAGCEVDVILGAQTKDALVCYAHYQNILPDNPSCSTDDGSFGHAGFCTDLVVEAIKEQTYDYVACCGPEPMMKIVSSITMEAGTSTYISLEKRMACGIGACLSCVVETDEGNKRACVDGPVFDARKVVW